MIGNSIWIALEGHSEKLRWRRTDSKSDLRRDNAFGNRFFLTYLELVVVLLDPYTISCVRGTTITKNSYSPRRLSSVVSAALVCGMW